MVTAGDLQNVTRPAASRLRGALRWLGAPLRPFLIALLPDRIRPEVSAGRYAAPLLSVILCACVAAFALGARVDVGPMVRAQNSGAVSPEMKDKPAEIKTDREIDEEIGKTTAVLRVKLGAEAVALTPLRIFALAFALLLLARYIGGKPTMARTLTVASLAAVPGAIRSLVTAIAAWRLPRVYPDELDQLVTFSRVPADAHPVLAHILAGVDMFTWWAVVILVVGMCAAAEIKLRKSLLAVAIGFALYLLITNLIMGGPPPGVGR